MHRFCGSIAHPCVDYGEGLHPPNHQRWGLSSCQNCSRLCPGAPAICGGGGLYSGSVTVWGHWWLRWQYGGVQVGTATADGSCNAGAITHSPSSPLQPGTSTSIQKESCTPAQPPDPPAQRCTAPRRICMPPCVCRQAQSLNLRTLCHCSPPPPPQDMPPASGRAFGFSLGMGPALCATQ